MSVQPKKHYTPEEYLALERVSFEKHEYLNGEIFPLGAGLEMMRTFPTMAGASFRHTTLVGSAFAALRPALRKHGCGIHANDLRIKTSSGLYAYPDIVIVCQKPEFLDNEFDTLVNPVAIIEVLSDSTQTYDRTKKFDHYRTIPTLRDYVLIEQTVLRVEHYSRIDNPQSPPDLTLWGFRAATKREEHIVFSGVDMHLNLIEVYEDIDFTNAED